MSKPKLPPDVRALMSILGKRRQYGLSRKERSDFGRLGAHARWDHMTPKERSDEMKRTILGARKRKARKLKLG